MQDNNYEKTVKQLETLQSRYPYGRYAQQAQMEIAYSYYKHSEPAPALAALDNFVKMYPNSAHLDYVYYLKGLINFNENINSLFGTMFKQDPSERDPAALRDSFDSFKELVTRFPASKYTPDSIQRMNYLVNTLASHEVNVARYYMKRSAFVAAANRAQYALKNYPQAPANEEGLLILVQAYDKLGMADLRNDAERVMKANFPKSKYLTGQAGDGRPWWQFWNWSY